MMNFKINNAHLIFLIAIFSILFFPQAFVFNKDINLISAFEVDPASVMASVNDMFYKYNMLVGYHSKFYGWTYFSINFFLLLPLKIFMDIFNIADKSLFYLSIKIIFFLIGLISSLLLFKVIEKISSSKNIALVSSLLYVSSSNFHFFYFVHPETTGALFLLLAIFLLLEYIENRNNKYYLFGIASCVLSALSKHPFFFISCFALIPFIIIKLEEENKKSKNKLNIFKIICKISFIAILILFVMHPYSIIHLEKFLKYQIYLIKDFENNNITFIENFNLWLPVVKKESLIVLSIFLAPISISVAFYNYIKKRNIYFLLYCINIITAIFMLILTINGNRLYYADYYLFPCQILFIMNMVFIAIFILKNLDKNKIYFKIASGLFLYGFVIYFSFSLYKNVPTLISRLDYKNSLAYKSYEYIKKNMTKEDKIVYDHMVGVPSEGGFDSCHFWNCGMDQKNMAIYNPNYVIIDSYQGEKHVSQKELKTLVDYVKNNKMHIVETVCGNPENNPNLDISYKNGISCIDVYKK